MRPRRLLPAKPNPFEWNETKNNSTVSEIDASCRVPLLALFGGAALWLVVGLLLALIASLTFHAPQMFADCPLLTYGHAQPAANDAILYGFAIPAALGVMLWIFARLSQTELVLPLVPIVAANIWHLGVLRRHRRHFDWRQHRFHLAGISARQFGFVVRRIFADRRFPPSPRSARGANANCIRRTGFCSPRCFGFRGFIRRQIFCSSSGHPVRGVAQAVIGWWFADNLIFVWLALVGIGTAFYFLPKLAGRPLQSHYFALFAFWTLIIFGTWCGIPARRAGSGVAAGVKLRCFRAD